MKVVLLIWYSNKNFSFRMIESYLASKINFEIWKCPIFASSASNFLTKYEQILSGCSLGCKNALNEIPQPWSHYPPRTVLLTSSATFDKGSVHLVKLSGCYQDSFRIVFGNNLESSKYLENFFAWKDFWPQIFHQVLNSIQILDSIWNLR